MTKPRLSDFRILDWGGDAESYFRAKTPPTETSYLRSIVDAVHDFQCLLAHLEPYALWERVRFLDFVYELVADETFIEETAPALEFYEYVRRFNDAQVHWSGDFDMSFFTADVRLHAMSEPLMTACAYDLYYFTSLAEKDSFRQHRLFPLLSQWTFEQRQCLASLVFALYASATNVPSEAAPPAAAGTFVGQLSSDPSFKLVRDAFASMPTISNNMIPWPPAGFGFNRQDLAFVLIALIRAGALPWPENALRTLIPHYFSDHTGKALPTNSLANQVTWARSGTSDRQPSAAAESYLRSWGVCSAT